MQKRSEATEQEAIVMWAKHSEAAHPELKHLFHPANGEKRDKVTAARLKGMGVKPGVPDLLLLYPKGCYIGMAIELKYGGNWPRTEQKAWLQQLRAVGYFAAVCWGQNGAIHLLEEYVKLGARQMMQEDCEELPDTPKALPDPEKQNRKQELLAKLNMVNRGESGAGIRNPGKPDHKKE